LAIRHVPALNQHLKSQQKRDPFETIRLAFTTREQRNALLFTVTLVLGQFTVISMMTPFYINNVGLEQTDIKWIYLVGGACTVVTGRFIGKTVDRIGRFKVFTIAAALSIIPILVITHLPQVHLGWVLAIAGMFFILISGRMIPANTITTSVVNPQHRGGFMSLNSAMMSLASGSSGIIAGNIIHKANENAPLENFEIVGFVAIGSTIISLFVVRLLKKIAEEKTATAEKATH
jgi:predicted MFS family arabinose efflux permease